MSFGENVKHFERLAPCSLLLIVGLAQIQNLPLHGLAAGHAAILDDAEVAMVLPVLLAIRAAQKHAKQQNARVPIGKTEGRSSLGGSL
jgi:hypothetical protein